MDTTLEDLRGATLDDVTVDWRNGIVRITFLPTPASHEACAIRASDFSRVDLPRAAAVPRAPRVVRSVTHVGTLTEIVMETGETLRIESAAFAIDTLGGT